VKRRRQGGEFNFILGSVAALGKEGLDSGSPNLSRREEILTPRRKGPETRRAFQFSPRLGDFALNSPRRPKELVRSIDLVVRADGFKDKGRLAFMFRQAKHEAKIVTSGGRPRTRQRAFEFVGAQRRGKRVGLQTSQERLQVVRRRRVFFEEARTNAGAGRRRCFTP